MATTHLAMRLALLPDDGPSGIASELEPFNSNREPDLPISGLATSRTGHILHALEASHWVIEGRNGAAGRRASLAFSK